MSSTPGSPERKIRPPIVAIVVGRINEERTSELDKSMQDLSEGQAADETPVEITAGESAAHTAVAFGVLGREDLNAPGGKAILYTHIGVQAKGAALGKEKSFSADLQNHNVTVRDCAARDSESSLAQIFFKRTNDGKQIVSKISARASNDKIPLDDDMKSWLERDLNQASIVVINASLPQLSLEIAKKAKERGVYVMLDAEKWTPETAALIRVSDGVIASDTFNPDDGDSPGVEGIMNFFRENGMKNTAVTSDAGKLWYDFYGETMPVAVQTIENPVDKRGAGGMLRGLVAYEFIRTDGDMSVALYSAAAFVSQSLELEGPRAWIAKLEPGKQPAQPESCLPADTMSDEPSPEYRMG